MTTYDATTALIVVDVQNDFADPAGSLYVNEGEKVVPFINEEMSRALDAGGFVAYTQDWHPPSTPHFEKDGGLWPVHCVQGSWGAELAGDLVVEGPRVRIGTGSGEGYSGFSVDPPRTSSELDDLLRERGIARVVVVGLATDYCVKATAVDALRKGYRTVVLREGTRAVDLVPGDGHRALEEMRVAGAEIE
jgi:nicotinamidase/pyrazinamidase